MERNTFRPIPLAIIGIWFLFIAIYTTFGRLHVQADGVILSRELTHGARPAAIYVLQDSTGQHTFTAGPTDASLSRDLPVGVHIVKSRWHLGYTIDGRQVSDFSINFYGGLAGIGIVCLLSAMRLFWNEKKAA